MAELQQHWRRQHKLGGPALTNSTPRSIGLGDELDSANTKQLATTTTTTTVSFERQQPTKLELVKPTRKRYFILLMFIVLEALKGFEWICMSSITSKASKYYQVDNLAINWTSILFMATFLVLAVPVGVSLNSVGLRNSILIGSVGTTIGTIIKCFSCKRDGFALHMFGQLIVGFVEPFFFSSYAQIASVWFPDTQVALATSASLIGSEVGVALGYIVPPLLVSTPIETSHGNDGDGSEELSVELDSIESGLLTMWIGTALISLINTLLIVIWFDEQPEHAPGFARLKQIQNERRASTEQTKQGAGGSHASAVRWNRLKDCASDVRKQARVFASFMADKNFLLLFVSFGVNVGTAYSVQTLLNQMIIRSSQDFNYTHVFAGVVIATTNETTTVLARQMPTETWSSLQQAQEDTIKCGIAGTMLIVAGFVGSAYTGYLLDKYHRYKSTVSSIYLLSPISVVALSLTLVTNNSWLLYAVCVPLGFGFTGYMSAGFDYAVEITYPKPEILSSTLLNISAQVFGIPISILGSLIVDAYGNLAVGAFFVLIQIGGQLLSCVQGGELRRQSVVSETRLGQVALTNDWTLKQQQQRHNIRTTPQANDD